jgi:pimeloyl-ACP methyl ester carboxylesterase
VAADPGPRDFQVGADGVSLTARGKWLGPAAPAVLFVNAVGMRAGLLDPVAAGFADAGFSFLTWELRGSPGPCRDLSDCTIPAHVEDGLAVLSAFGVSRVHLAGWCTGASVAGHMAALLGNQAASLTTVDGAFLFGGSPGGPLGNAMYEMCGEIVADVSRGAHYHVLTAPRGTEGKVLGIEDSRLLAEVTLPYRGEVEDLVRYAHGIRASCDYDPVQMCSRIARPTLLLAHSDDKMVSSKKSTKAAELIPDSQLIIIDSGGHYDLFIDPDCVSVMSGFMRAAVPV